ncbi:hypothetical protein METBIDRAFT_11234 [Metschnikowia bicuspidata var. bicuspidata NRRL YB-4993]|uniref:SUN-domain-containing protein n=1 Tax=Metschnikowia bicuspidata var. bicuspidata NRRL YB-4993 TaxID=869754 RepID=A0A1A0HEQ7_9ASCO|nr:hypothetical protein METBIDRAFT_11234 [Metschnikowia bicuspidata var. bicuspidata NRRL YB-4993]OBA22393.1 hypothetical protein METBIDRAFT_11234 [Metschnikowia bicuspidata var. bicuspidata NRRL YB-4993]
MRFFAPIALLAATACAAPSKRSVTCEFPTDEGLVEITPTLLNAGWALSPDQECSAGSYCPYACPPGQLMNQWDPESTSYTTSESQNGGLYCESDGSWSKPFDRSFCTNGTNTVYVDNSASDMVAFCQTVLPGNEAMLIPTSVGAGDLQVLAVPSEDYWASTAAHYYINPLGVSTDEGCVWGSSDNPYGNWAPYVAGANTDSDDNTYVKIGWNPIYIETFTDLPSFGLRITCEDESACNGLSCEIDPSVLGFNGVSSDDAAVADGAAYCIVTTTNLAVAKIEVFEV